MQKRVDAWKQAQELLDPIMNYDTVQTHTLRNAFGTTHVITDVEQRIDHTIRVADWLLEGEDEEEKVEEVGFEVESTTETTVDVV